MRLVRFFIGFLLGLSAFWHFAAGAVSSDTVTYANRDIVTQRALADFYVEYELFAYIDKPLERIMIMSALHGAIQDAFNEAGLQIMSPHFAFQPKQDVVIPREKWFDPSERP